MNPKWKILREKWKPITDHEDYLISNTGLVKSTKTGKLLSIDNLRGGYKSIHINKKSFKIHRLVAKEFIPNDDPTKTVVNHIDANRLNNCITNLEWVTTAENTKQGYITGNNRVTKRAVLQLDLDGNLIRKFESFKEAYEVTGVKGNIGLVCKGVRKTMGGYKWQFAEANPNELHEDPPDLDEFVQIKGFVNHQIDRNGNIYSTRFRKMMKVQINADGYKVVSLANNKVKKTFLVHRLVAEHFIPKIEGKDLVNHIDSNKLNSHVDNLEWVNNSENVKHANNQKAIKEKERKDGSDSDSYSDSEDSEEEKYVKKEKKLETKKLQTPKLVVKATNGSGEKSEDCIKVKKVIKVKKDDSDTEEKRAKVQGKSAAKLLSSK